MKIRSAIVAAVALVGVATSAYARPYHRHHHPYHPPHHHWHHHR